MGRVRAVGVVQNKQRSGSSQELSEMLGVSVETLRSLVKRKVLRSPKGHTWDFVKSCRDIRNNMNRGMAWEKACAYLSGLEGEKRPDGEGGASDRVSEANCKAKYNAPEVVAESATVAVEKRGRGRPKKNMASDSGEIAPDKRSGAIPVQFPVQSGKAGGESGMPFLEADGIGLEAAVRRLRVLEQKLHGKMEEAVESQDMETAEEFPRRFKAWTVAIEQLRKMEADLLDVLEQRGELIRVADVREWAVRNAQGVKQRFLGLPALLAPKLDKARWQVIQDQMESGIRNVLGELSTEPRV